MCVYDQNYALVIVTQPKKEESPNKFNRISQCDYLGYDDPGDNDDLDRVRRRRRRRPGIGLRS